MYVNWSKNNHLNIQIPTETSKAKHSLLDCLRWFSKLNTILIHKNDPKYYIMVIEDQMNINQSQHK